jgi:hypothetical protein
VWSQSAIALREGAVRVADAEGAYEAIKHIMGKRIASSDSIASFGFFDVP